MTIGFCSVIQMRPEWLLVKRGRSQVSSMLKGLLSVPSKILASRDQKMLKPTLEASLNSKTGSPSTSKDLKSSVTGSLLSRRTQRTCTDSFDNDIAFLRVSLNLKNLMRYVCLALVLSLC